ncbi:MAG: glycosyltransferase [Planctomycetota bacterium]|nr:MAG: glycosyltransferase [Planctomycetota bacterium]
MSGQRLAFVANTRLPSERAQALQVVQMAAAFARAALEVELLHARRRREHPLPAGQDLWSHYGVPSGPRPTVRAIPCSDWIESVPVALQYIPARMQELSFARNAARALREHAAHTWVYSREIECALHLVRAGAPHVFLEVHRVPGGRTRRRWLDAAVRGVRGVVAISGGVREDLVAAGVPADKLCVEHDGYEAARFARLPSREAARDALKLPQGASIVAYTGGLLEWKGVDVLVDAARELDSVLFVIAGGMAADVEKLRARAAGLANVRIDGFQAPERVPTYLAAADVAALPNRAQPAISARYTSPLKLFECMAAGLPMVASDLPALRDCLAEGEARFAQPDDPRALAAAIAGLLADRAGRASMRERLLARAAAHTWDARATRIARWMRERASDR